MIGEAPGASPLSSTNALLAQLEHLCRFLACDKGRSGIDVCRRHSLVKAIHRQIDDGQIAQEILLKIDSERHFPVDQRLQHFRREVDCAEFDLAGDPPLFQRVERRNGGGRTEGKGAIRIWMGGQIGLDAGLHFRGVHGDGEYLRLPAHSIDKAAAGLIIAGITDLMIYTHPVSHAFGAEPRRRLLSGIEVRARPDVEYLRP